MALNLKVTTPLIIGVAFMLTCLEPSAATADNLPTGNTPGSKYTISYADWDYVLANSVLKTGRSDRRPASRATLKNTATRIKHGNTKATGLEGNRVLFNEFDDRHRALLLAIRTDLEAVPDTMPLQNFDKSEQLAYWLNLHNVAVMLEVAKNYPIKNIKRIAVGKKSIWTKKNMSIGGVATSIEDIEKHIVGNWSNPLVLYGLFMGTVGSPNIRTKAFTAERLTEQLRENAAEFVNSLRGVRFWDDEARISLHYKMGAKFFPEFQRDVKKHMIQFADPLLAKKLAAAKRFNPKGYDWSIADLKNGDSYGGSSHNTNPGALVHFIETPDAAAPGGAKLNLNTYITDPSVINHSASGLPPHVSRFFNKLKERNSLRQRKTKVTIEEFTSVQEGRVSTKK